MSDIVIDPRLLRDTLPLACSALSELRLMNDSRYLWLVLIPRIDGAVEWFDLAPAPRQALFEEVMLCGEALTALGALKVNTGALGNIVRQLHVHVLARQDADPAWPGPVWGHSPAVPYLHPERLQRHTALRNSVLARRFDFLTPEAISDAATG